MTQRKDGFYNLYIKRILDICCALAAMVFFCWLYAVVAVLVRLKLGSPVIFRQARPGKDENIFYLYKFRSMTDERDAEGKLLPDEVRLTKFGRLLRATSLDELPEAWNILRGDMSVIGPRPLLVQYLPLYNEEQHRRHLVRPGLSGYAQVHGRNTVSWQDKFKMDVWYVEHLSFWEDVKLVWLSFYTALKHEGISARGEATVQYFQGNEEEKTTV